MKRPHIRSCEFTFSRGTYRLLHFRFPLWTWRDNLHHPLWSVRGLPLGTWVKTELRVVGISVLANRQPSHLLFLLKNVGYICSIGFPSECCPSVSSQMCLRQGLRWETRYLQFPRPPLTLIFLSAFVPPFHPCSFSWGGDMFTLRQSRKHTLPFRYGIIWKDIEPYSFAPCCVPESPVWSPPHSCHPFVRAPEIATTTARTVYLYNKTMLQKAFYFQLC